MTKNFFNKKGKLCGWLSTGIYRKRVDSTKHRLRVMNAYGIDKAIVDELKTLECKEIRICETDTGTVFKIGFDKFCAFGVSRTLDGEQIFLPIHYFERYDTKQEEVEGLAKVVIG